MATARTLVEGRWAFDYTPRREMTAFHQRATKNAFLICHRRYGKALCTRTPILTHNRGWTTMGCLVAGDVVYDEQGHPTEVLQAHDYLHDRECYAVEFSDGASIVADAEHLWYTETKLDRSHTVRTPEGRIRAPKRGAVRTTREISLTLMARGETNHAVPVPKPLDPPPSGDSSPLPIPPYILGLWLGDGTARAPHITTEDAEIVDALHVYATSVGLVLKPLLSSHAGNATTYSLTHPDGGPGESFTRKLRVLGVFGNKHVPDMYLTAPISQRMALLRGLLDTDGTINKKGTAVDLTLKRGALFDDAVELIRGLGNKPTVSTRYLDGKPYDRAMFKPLSGNPFSLRRKARRYTPPAH